MSQISLIKSNKIRTKLLIFISNELNLINKRNKLLINSKLPSTKNCEFTILERNIIKNNDIQYKIHNNKKNYNSVPKKYFFDEKTNTNNISKEHEIFISPIKKTQKIEISKNKNLLLLTNDDLINNNLNNSNVNNNSVIYENNNKEIDKEKMTQNIKILRKFCFTLKKRKLNYVSCKSMRNKSDIIRRKKYSRKINNICSSTCVNVLKKNLIKVNYINSIVATENDKSIDNIDINDNKLVFHNKKKKKKSNYFNLYHNEDNNNNDFMNANNIINLMQL